MLAPLPSLRKGVPPPGRGYIGLSCAASFSSLTLCPSSACRHRTLAVDNFAKRSRSRSRWASGSVHDCLPQMVSAPSSAKQKKFLPVIDTSHDQQSRFGCGQHALISLALHVFQVKVVIARSPKWEPSWPRPED